MTSVGYRFHNFDGFSRYLNGRRHAFLIEHEVLPTERLTLGLGYKYLPRKTKLSLGDLKGQQAKAWFKLDPIAKNYFIESSFKYSLLKHSDKRQMDIKGDLKNSEFKIGVFKRLDDFWYLGINYQFDQLSSSSPNLDYVNHTGGITFSYDY